MDATTPRTAEELTQWVRARDGALVLFTEGGCRVAEAIEPKLQAMARERFPKLEQVVISRDDAPELFAQLGIFVFPTVVAWFGGKETARFVRTFSLDAVAEALERPYQIVFD
jgi:thioredoxin-like negative regulator of GroEL